MTDAEREVIEAARALSQRSWTNMEPWIDESKRLHAAVRALEPYRVGSECVGGRAHGLFPIIGFGTTVAYVSFRPDGEKIAAALNEKAAREAGKP